MLRKVQAELIGLTMALYGSAVGWVDVLHACHLMTMSYFLPMNDGSVMPMADIHKSKHGEPWECHVSWHLDPCMPVVLIDSFVGMIGQSYGFPDDALAVLKTCFCSMPLGSRLEVAADGSFSAVDTRTGAVLSSPTVAAISIPTLSPADLNAAWRSWICEMRVLLAPMGIHR